MNPYRIDGPAIISFSGGRTSAYMLHEIVRAWDGKLPDDVHICFANTGKERPETLRFVHECGSRWGVHIHWLEWTQREKPCFVEVGYNSASRNGEPFAELIRRKKITPNAMMRFCTEELKVRVLEEYAQSLGWLTWSTVIGLRYDEGRRVLKALARNDEGKRRDKALMPLSKAKATKATIQEFWAAQPFDLGLQSYQGNCDLCFLKSRRTLQEIIRETPGCATWWQEQEIVGKGSFVTEYSYTALANAARDQDNLFDGVGEEYDTECGLTCAGA